ncbi:hypothetical protein BH23ACT9_BH23ACT9_01930 [soil metagenome]
MATAKKTTTRKTTARKTTAKSATTRPNSTKTAAATKTDQGFALSLGSFDLSTVDVKALATDYAYATVGATDRAVEAARELPQKLETLRKERKVESFVKEAPAKLQGELNGNFETLRKEIDGYAARGRKVIESISNAQSTKRALSQTENARSQVKGAVTSIRKAVEQGTDAVEGAAGRIGVRRSA